MSITKRQESIIEWLILHPGSRISEIKTGIKEEVPTPTLNRDLRNLVEQNILVRTGTTRNIAYHVSRDYQILNRTFDQSYFDKEADQRTGNKQFTHDIFALLERPLFTEDELQELTKLQHIYEEKIKTISDTLLHKETERLSIELSWKSSQIEGNTYSLLDTELLLTQQIQAPGKTAEEATMLLNHKTAIDYLFDGRIVLQPLTVRDIEDIHSLLIKEMGVSRNLRTRLVRITGTTYTPPDNEHQIREYMEATCTLINQRTSIFEKALLAVLLISYIQPFEDGNKRTARITANGIMIASHYCPLSYRSIDPRDYKKAMLLFYEQNNITTFKKIFTGQFAFAVNNYF